MRNATLRNRLFYSLANQLSTVSFTLLAFEKMDRASFYDQVYQVVRLIPEGRVTSYGAIANYLGTKGSSRMVGYAMNGAGAVIPQIPAHRVVNRNGLLTGKFHFESPTKMEELLALEGVKVVDDKVVDFKNLYWNPAEELDLER